MCVCTCECVCILSCLTQWTTNCGSYVFYGNLLSFLEIWHRDVIESVAGRCWRCKNWMSPLSEKNIWQGYSGLLFFSICILSLGPGFPISKTIWCLDYILEFFEEFPLRFFGDSIIQHEAGRCAKSRDMYEIGIECPYMISRQEIYRIWEAHKSFKNVQREVKMPTVPFHSPRWVVLTCLSPSLPLLLYSFSQSKRRNALAYLVLSGLIFLCPK